MKRRIFIKNTSSAIVGTALTPELFSASWAPENISDQKLKGFIVSDAHFGWKNDQQPEPEIQQEMMDRILKRFPDLDVFLDAGDAHHSGLRGESGDIARGDWTDIIMGSCGTSPAYFVMGNHDLSPLNEDGEWRCNELGSIPCRPYFSFDLKGIHFISLPELEWVTLVNKESIEWLKLDLEINKDKSIILLSHNNLKNTTTPFGESGYRGLINTDEVLSILNQHPNILAWMHGHNHTYEVLKKYQKLFVSTGRIGGFVPPPVWGRVGQGHLGGIYFEVSSNKLVVRCYSATAEKFMDELGDTHLSGELKSQTTLNSRANPAYSYGVGGMLDGRRIPVFNHHTSAGSHAELFVTGTDTPVINDDPEFKNYGVHVAGGNIGTFWYMAGSSVGPGGFRPENNIWEWQDPGVRLLPQESPDKTVDVSIPGHNQGKSHFRCSPHHTYQATLQLESPEGGQQLQLRIVFQTNKGRELASVEMPAEKIKPGLNTFEAKAALPAEAVSETIYTDPSRNQLIQVMVVATFSQLTSGLTLKKYRLLAEDASIDTLNPEIIIGEKRFPHTGRVPEGKILRYDIELPSVERSVYSCKVEGNQRVTWLVRRPMIQWQVRNATVADKGDYLEVGPLRNTWTHRKEAIISPVEQGSTRFVHRLKNTNKVRIFPLTPKNKKELKIEVLECGEQAEISVYSKQAPSRVTGTNSWKYQAPVLSINVKSGDRILIQ